jgi:hypothetical protein
VPYGFTFGIIAHFYSPLASPVIIGDTGSGGQIFQTDFTGSGSYQRSCCPARSNGSYDAQVRLERIKQRDQQLQQHRRQSSDSRRSGSSSATASLTLRQLQEIGAVAPTVSDRTANNQLTGLPLAQGDSISGSTGNTRSWSACRFEPSVGFFNVFNFANFNLPPGVRLRVGSMKVRPPSTAFKKTTSDATTFRVGAGTGVFGLGAPRAIEWGLKVTF